MTEATVATGKVNGVSLTDALDTLREVELFAYEHGLHEMGWPLAATITTHVERLHAAATGRLTPDMLAELAVECDDVGAKSDRVRDMLNEARAALARVGAPYSPEQDKDRLYYPLLFLVKALESYDEEWVDPRLTSVAR